ncbi:MAG: TIGR00725 family protein [Methanomassiliicoccales archaeon]
MLNIGVIGGSRADSAHLSMARETGRLLAKRGICVICGGLTGVMEEVARGVSEADGICIGILPGYSRREGNSYLRVALPTGMGFARNFLIVRASDSLIAIDGSNGTLSEASFAIAEGKSVVSLDSHILKRDKKWEGTFIVASNVEQAVESAIKEAEKWSEAENVDYSEAWRNRN